MLKALYIIHPWGNYTFKYSSFFIFKKLIKKHVHKQVFVQMSEASQHRTGHHISTEAACGI